MTCNAENHTPENTTGKTSRRGLRRMSSRRLMVAAGAMMTLLASATLSSTAVAADGTSTTVGADSTYRIFLHGFLSDGIDSYTASDSTKPQFVQTTKGTGSGDWAVVPSPNGKFMYAPGGDKKLRVYSIGADGRLTALPQATGTLSDMPVDMAFSPDGKYGYVTVGLLNSKVEVFAFQPDGTPVPVDAPKSLGSATLAMPTVSPDGRNLYVTNYGAKQVMRYALRSDGTIGGLQETESTTDLGAIFATFTPDGRHLYVANEMGADVAAFNVAADGSLTPVPGSPFKAGNLPHAMVPSHDGKYLYVPNTGSNSISAYAIQDDGVLKELPGSPFAGGPDGTAPEMAVLSPSGKVLWDADSVPADGFGLPTVALHKFDVRPDGSLVRDDSATVKTDKVFADGRGTSLIP